MGSKEKIKKLASLKNQQAQSCELTYFDDYDY